MKVLGFFLFVALGPLSVPAFTPTQSIRTTFKYLALTQQKSSWQSSQEGEMEQSATPAISNRRTWIQQLVIVSTTTTWTRPVWAATRPPLPDLMYTILRVREATEQETRLISSGKFKDVQRANIKLAVRFMVENYRLADAFVAAAAYLEGNERRIAAGNVGQAAVQNLVTILEYFDSADVQNLKVSL